MASAATPRRPTSGKFYDSDADSDEDVAMTSKTPVGDKRGHGVMTKSEPAPPPTHAYDDSPTDSDTDIQPAKKVHVRPPSTAGRKQQPRRPASRRTNNNNNNNTPKPPELMAEGRQKTLAGPHDAKIKDLYMSQNKQQDVGAVVAIPDVFTTGVMDASVIAELERMCGPSHWVNIPTEEVPLFQREDDERLRQMVGNTREYEQVRGFAIIQGFLNKLKPSSSPTPAGQTGMYKHTELVPREYEEKQLRSPRALETPCRAAKKCVCFDMFGFVMKEFMLPSNAAEIARTGRKGTDGGMCLVCLRQTAQYLQVKARITGIEPAVEYLSQSHSNIVNQVGEYTLDYCLEPGFGIIDPIVINYWPGYRHVTNGTEHVLLQVGYEICTQAHIDNLNFR